jgi:uncharacterized protein (TIGR02246 family)
LRGFRSALTLLLPAAVLLPACRIEPNPRPETFNVDSAARADIRATMAAYRDALLDNDARAIAAFYTAEARRLEPDAPDLVGGSEIRDAMQQFFNAGGTITDVVTESEDIHVDGPVAFELGTFEERHRTGDGTESTTRGRYMIRWRRGAEARWRIDHLLLNHLPAEPAVAADSVSGAG